MKASKASICRWLSMGGEMTKLGGPRKRQAPSLQIQCNSLADSPAMRGDCVEQHFPFRVNWRKCDVLPHHDCIRSRCVVDLGNPVCCRGQTRDALTMAKFPVQSTDHVPLLPALSDAPPALTIGATRMGLTSSEHADSSDPPSSSHSPRRRPRSVLSF